MEDAVHCNSNSLIVGVDRFWVVRSADWVERSSGGQERLDGFVSEDEQRRQRPETGRECFVAASVADAVIDLFTAKSLRLDRLPRSRHELFAACATCATARKMANPSTFSWIHSLGEIVG